MPRLAHPLIAYHMLALRYNDPPATGASNATRPSAQACSAAKIERHESPGAERP